MSQDNVEIVRRALEASTRRDDEATFALYEPEVEIYGQVDGATYPRVDWRPLVLP